MVARIVESGTVDDFHPGGLAELIAHLSIRTRSVRKFGSEVFHRVHALMRTILSKDANLMVLLTSQFRSGGELRDSILEKLSVENPESAEGRAISDLIAGHSKELAKALIRENRSVVEQAIEAHIGLQKELLPGAVRLGFIDSMVRNWGADARLESFKGLNFFVVRSSTPLILGDTVAVFETGGERRFVPFVSAEDDLKTCYLPLSPDTALMACRNSNPPSFDAGQWNLIVARCSDDFIVSSIEISQEDRVLQEMGKWAGVFSERQWRQLARQMEKDLLAGKWWGSSSN